MASTPSASALSAVLRCQGNILARNQANKKRPAASVYGLGKTYGPKSLDRSYIRALLGFLFYRDSVEIPGVVSVSAQFKSQSAKTNSEAKDPLAKISDCHKIKLKSHYDRVAFTSHGLSCKSNAVLRLDDTRLWKVISESHARTFCLCIICAHRKSTMNRNDMQSVFALGLLSLLKNRPIYLTAAVADAVRTRFGPDRTNQLHPDCDKVSGCVRCNTTHHKEDESETRLGHDSEPEE